VALAGAAAAGLAGSAYVVQRRAVRHWRADGAALAAAGRSLPADLAHRFVPADDGARLHVVERGQGPPLVLVHGVTLGVAAWAPQLRDLSARHRVVAVGQRGHGQSVAGTEEYSLERLAADLAEVLQALDLRDVVLVGHSMGGMVAQLLALSDPECFRRRVAGLALVATTAGPVVPGPAATAVARVLTAGGGRRLRAAERRGRPLVPGDDLLAWVTRVSFGTHPDPADLELTRSMIGAMSPAAMAELLGPLLRFDVHRRLAQIRVPTTVVVGTRDLLTPPRMARTLVAGLEGAETVLLPGCGHMVMLERPAELAEALEALAARAVRPGPE
jgi:pimeloyl-ACP methyl ester carboxylesterase